MAVGLKMGAARMSGVGRALVMAMVSGAMPGLVAQAQEERQAADPVVGESLVKDREIFVDSLATGYRASKLLGAGVFNDKGEQIGSVNDIIVGSDLQVSVAVLSVGGFLGLGSHLIAIPAMRFETNSSGEVVLPGATKASLAEYPAFRYVD